jgi:hypothetical protein
MRASILLLPLSLGLGLVGCKWTDFDDLEDETWVRSTDDPDLGSNDFAIAIAGVSTGSPGGVLAVISDDTPNLSTIEYNSAGGAGVGATPMKLGEQNIGALGDAPVFVSDDAGHIGLVEKSITGGNFTVLFGTASAPAALQTMAASNPTPTPEAAVFISSDLMFAAGDSFYTVAAAGGTAKVCPAKDNNDQPLQVAAMDADASDVWVWTKTGTFLRYPLADIAACAATLVPTGPVYTTPSFTPAAGARVHVSGGFAILAGKQTTSRNGEIHVVDLSTMMRVGEVVPVEGLRSSVLAEFDTGTYLAVGVPDRQVGGVVAGAVDLFEYTPASGALVGSPTTTLHDADPESGQQFGRALTTMNFGGEPILVAGTKEEVFAYYRTSVYDHLP